MVNGPNVYAYVLGNPVQYSDPDGRFVYIPLLILLALGSLVALYGTAKIGCVLSHLKHRARQIQQANWIHSDKWFHCMGMCEAKKNCGVGAEAIARRLGIVRELYQHEPVDDQIGDLSANETGLAACDNETCEEACSDLNPNPGLFQPSDWPSR